MKIIYIVDWSGSSNSGVSAKIASQINAWKSLNHEIELVQICKKNSKIRVGGLNSKYFLYSGKWNRITARYQANKYLKSRIDVNFVYRRYGILLPFEILSVKKLPTFIELNTNNDIFYRDRGFVTYGWHKLQQISIGKKVLGVCAVTEEIAKLNCNRYSNIGVFTNGIVVPKNLPKRNRAKQVTRLIFLSGDKNSWNGIEKLQNIAAQLPELEFLLVGNHNIKSKLPNLKVQKFKSGKKLKTLLSTCDFGISTLALERVGLTEACPLKNRTYLVHGLPIIGIFVDPAFDQDSSFYFLLEVSNDGVILNLHELRKFLNHWKDRSITRNQISQINIDKIERMRLDFIESALLAL